VIDRSRKEHQFENAPLTERDLSAITDSFITTLRTTYHPRLEYPRDPPAVRETPTFHRKSAK
jgi:membrane-associated HD superfamily phosphohydrolase